MLQINESLLSSHTIYQELLHINYSYFKDDKGDDDDDDDEDEKEEEEEELKRGGE